MELRDERVDCDVVVAVALALVVHVGTACGVVPRDKAERDVVVMGVKRRFSELGSGEEKTELAAEEVKVSAVGVRLAEEVSETTN